LANVLGLIGMVVFIVAVIGLAAGVTYAIVRISPSSRKAKNGTATAKTS
jgi:hypothetical protein